METELDNESSRASEDDSSKGWTRLYLVVVGVLAAQIALFAWLTKTFE